MTDTSARRTQEQRRAETERRVLDAATALIARTGSRSVTLAQVGQEAGYSRGIVYHQFGSRDRLIEAVLDRAQRLDLPEYAGNGLEHVVGIVESYLQIVARRVPSTRAFLQLWMEAIAADEVVAPLFAQRDEEFRRLLRDAVRRGLADGSISSDVEPAAAGVMLMALLRGTGLQFIATPAVDDPQAVIRETVRMVQTAFSGTP
jgi:AcrR family transcriptional regulator